MSDYQQWSTLGDVRAFVEKFKDEPDDMPIIVATNISPSDSPHRKEASE